MVAKQYGGCREAESNRKQDRKMATFASIVVISQGTKSL